jgi:hypothetical protein
VKLIWHIIAKDLRRDKWALGFWVALFGAHFGLGAAFLAADPTDLEGIDQLRWGNILITIFEFAIGYLLALRWVQADDLSGTRMFWVTRPISGGRLLAAKTMGLFLVFGLLPVLLWLPWWINCGLGLPEIGWLAIETFGWQLLLIAPALLIGSLTGDLGRAIMWSLILVAAVLAWSILGQSNLTSANFRHFSRGFAGIWFSRLWVAGALLVAGFLAIAAVQYHTRNVLRSMVRVSVLAVMVGLVGRFWVLDFSDKVAGWGQPPAPVLEPGLAEHISLSPKNARVSPYTYRERTAAGVENVHSLIVSIEVNGLPEEMGLVGEHTAQALLWDDGQVIRIDQPRQSSTSRVDKVFRAKLALPAVGPDPETVSWGRARLKKANAERATKGLPPLDDYWGLVEDEQRKMRVYLSMPESQLARLKLQAPAYTAHLEASLVRPEIMQQVPLEPGTRGTGELRSLLVTGLDDRVLKHVETTPAFFRDGLFQVHSVRKLPKPRLRTSVWTVNRLTGDLASVGRRSLVVTEISVGGVAIKWNETTLSPAKWIRNNEWVVKDPDWQRNTLLVMTVDRVVGHFTREIRSGRLAVQFPPEVPAGVNLPEGSTSTGSN